MTPAAASAPSGSFRMLTSATGFLLASRASWYMKHSLPSGAQRTCQSPKVSRTISMTSGCAGRARLSGSAGAAAPSAGRGGRRIGRGRRRGRGPGLAGAGARGVAGASAAGAGRRARRLLGGDGPRERQREGGQEQADTDRLHRRLASR